MTAHQIDWDIVAYSLKPYSVRYRSADDCRRRYETVILPREEANKQLTISSGSLLQNELIKGDPPSTPKKKQKGNFWTYVCVCSF